MYLPSPHQPPMYVPHLYCSHIIFHLYCTYTSDQCTCLICTAAISFSICTVLTHQTNVHASSVLQPYHFPTRRQMYSHIICLHNISSHHNSISCRCNNWKGGISDKNLTTTIPNGWVCLSHWPTKIKKKRRRKKFQMSRLVAWSWLSSVTFVSATIWLSLFTSNVIGYK